MSGDGRFGSIQGLLASKPASSAQAPLRVVADQPNDVHEPSSPPPKDARPSTAKRPEAKRSSTSDGGLARVGVRLRPDLYASLVARATATGQSHGNVVLYAIEDAHVHQVLEDLVTPNDTERGLFARTRARSLAEPRVPVEIRLRVKALEQLDSLVQAHGAASRTALIIAALEYHFRRAQEDE